MSNASDILREMTSRTNARQPQPVPQEAPVQPNDPVTALEEAREVIFAQEGALSRLCASPTIHATIVAIGGQIDSDNFQKDDKVQVIDKDSPYVGRVGTIIANVDASTGTVRTQFWGVKERPHLRIGTVGKAQCKLLCKNDGTNITIVSDNKLYDVWAWHELGEAKVGYTAKVNSQTQQIIEIIPSNGCGIVAKINRKIDDGNVEIDMNGSKKSVICTFADAEEGDEIVVDPAGIVAVKHISANTRYALKEALNVSWESIGGCQDAKQELMEAIVLPSKHPAVFKHYNKKPPHGILIFGPPGCGKTLCGKAAATSVAQLHGKESVASGFNYVKGPELLSMWVGEQEGNTRALFAHSRRHHERHGYPCVTFVDEADSIVMARSHGGATSRHNEPWRDSLVAMWLAEMDGMSDHNGIFIFATNRPMSLDGAFVREGRIDRKIKISRPTIDTAPEIFKIHLAGVPLHGTDVREVIGIALAEITAGHRMLCSIKHMAETVPFTLGDCLSGAMIAGIISHAQSYAIRRDLSSGSMTGVTIPDFKRSIEESYASHRSTDLHYDLVDFYDKMKWDEKNCQIERAI